MKRLMVAALLGAAFVTFAPRGSEAANTCMGKPVDVMGTSKDDVISPRWEDDKNKDGWIVYAGGKGNDTFRQTDLDGGSVTEVIACGYAGNDTFLGAWNKVDGGSGTDIAKLATCWFDWDEQSILKIESAGLSWKACEGVP